MELKPERFGKCEIRCLKTCHKDSVVSKPEIYSTRLRNDVKVPAGSSSEERLQELDGKSVILGMCQIVFVCKCSKPVCEEDRALWCLHVYLVLQMSLAVFQSQVML